MVGELVTFPLRVGVRVTQMWMRAAGQAAGMAYDVAAHLLERDGHDQRPATPARPATAARERAASGAGMERATSREAQKPAPRPAAGNGATTPAREAAPPPLEPEPAHVSEEPELVDEFAEPGAEDGAGAEVHIVEPWEGYGRLSVQDITTRLTTATAAELAAVELYESAHEARQTILAAVERELRRANGSGSPTQERNR